LRRFHFSVPKICSESGHDLRYARVSTDAQDLAAQLADLTAAGRERVFREKIGGDTADRPQLKKLMATIAAGDVLIIPLSIASHATPRTYL